VERCSTSAYSYLAFDGLISGLQAGPSLGEKLINLLAEFHDLGLKGCDAVWRTRTVGVSAFGW
jgi:hypothetical protein